jgi:hypothetical protein
MLPKKFDFALMQHFTEHRSNSGVFLTSVKYRIYTVFTFLPIATNPLN